MAKQTFLVWEQNQGQTRDDAKRVQGFDHEDAATEWARPMPTGCASPDGKKS